MNSSLLEQHSIEHTQKASFMACYYQIYDSETKNVEFVLEMILRFGCSHIILWGQHIAAATAATAATAANADCLSKCLNQNPDERIRLNFSRKW